MVNTKNGHLVFKKWIDLVKYASDNLVDTKVYPEHEVANGRLKFCLKLYGENKSYTYVGPYKDNSFDKMMKLLTKLNWPHKDIINMSHLNEQRVSFSDWKHLEKCASKNFVNAKVHIECETKDNMFYFNLRVLEDDIVFAYNGPYDKDCYSKVTNLLRKLNPPAHMSPLPRI